MNPSQSFHPWVAPLGWLALEASLVVLAALALQPLLRTAAARRSLWRAALLALLAVLAAELTGTGSQLPAQLRTAWQTTFPAPVPPIPPPIAIPPTEPPDSTPITHHPFPIPSAEAPAPLAFTPEPLAPPPPLPLSHPPTISPAPLFLWLAGLAAFLARSAFTHAGFAWLRLRHFLPAAESLRERVQALAARLGLRRRVRVLASERLRAPAAFGWVRPGVGVPGDFTARFAPAQQDVMLAHELAHLAARDPLWQLLADLTAAALWWHPLAWVARRQHRLAGELAADDASQALPDGPVVLAECLLALGQEAADAPRAALGMAGFRSQLGRRVERLVALPRSDWQTPSRLRLALQTTTALAALAALALLPGCAANRAANEAPTSLLAKWWQAKSKPASSEQQTAVSQRPATPAPANTEPVTIQGRVSFNGTPPPEHEIPLPPPVLAKLLKPVSTMNLGSLTTVTNGQTNTLHFETAVSYSIAADRLLAGLSRELGRDLTHLRLETETVSPPLQEFCSRHGIRHHETTGPLIRFYAGLVTFTGSKADSALVAQLLTALVQPRLKTRLHRVSPDGGLADVVVYVKAGLEGQSFAPTTNTQVIRVMGFEFWPYIAAVEVGQPIRWENHQSETFNLNPTPTNLPSRQFNRVLLPDRPIESALLAPEEFVRVRTDVYPWMFHYVSAFEHPYFAVTDAEGRFRFPQPLPPGKYTLAALHRRAGERTQEIDLTVPLPAGQPVPSIEFRFPGQPGAATPALRSSPAAFTTPPPSAADFTPSKPPTRAELLERKARVEAQIKEAEKLYIPSHPKQLGLRKQLETVEEALRQTPPVGDDVRSLTPPPPTSQRLVTSSPTNAPLPAATEPRTALDNLALADVILKEIADRWPQFRADWKLAKETLPESHPKFTELKKQVESMTSERTTVFELEQVTQSLRRTATLQEHFESPLLTPTNRLQLYTGFGYKLKVPPANSGEATEKELEHARVWFQEQCHLLQHRQAMLLAQLSKQPLNITPIKLTNSLDISVGRQLFVDDFLVESNSLKRTWHRPTFNSELPQLVVNAQAPLLGEFPFSESVRYDSTNQVFNLRFIYRTNTASYTSPSGTNWHEAVIQPETSLLRGRPTNATTHYERLNVTLQKFAKTPDIFLGFSREGALFRMTSFKPFIPLPKPDDGSQWTDLHPLTNGFLVVGRNLHFYFGGRVQRAGETHASAAVGLATLRRDGFASLDAGPEGGVMTTKPVTFTGRYLFVNLKTNAPNGELRVEILHPDGRPITVTKNDTKQESQPFALASANPLAADQTLMTVMWAGGTNDLAMLVGRPVRFRFHLKNASLYSFWTSDSRFGRSHGPVAGGGPHFTEEVDTIGNRSYRPFPVVSTNTPPPKPSASAPADDDVRSLTPPQTPDPKPQPPPTSQSLGTSSPTAEEVVQAEAARRQERKVALDKLLGEARQFQKVKSWTNAVVRYEEAAGLAKQLAGEAVEKPYRVALAGLTHCRIQLAIALQETYEFKAAAAEVDKVLLFEPNSPLVEQFKRFNEQVEAAHGGRSRQQAPAGPKELMEARSRVMSLVRDGKLHFEVGEHAKSKLSLEEAIKIDPLNDAAFFYLRLVMEAQFERESRQREDAHQGRTVAVAQKWNDSTRSQNGLPVPNPYYRTNSQVPFLTHSSKGAQLINRKLDQIVLPEVHFDGVPLVGVVQRLIEDGKKFDPEKTGLNFLINDAAPAAPLLDAAGNPVPVARPVALSEGLIRVSQPLKNLTLRQALDVICKTAELPTQYSVEEYAIAFIPRGPVAYYSRIFRVNPDAFMQGLQGVVGNPAVGQSGPAAPAAPGRATVPAPVPATQRTPAEANALVRQFFQSAGVTSLGATNGSTRVFFNPANGLLTARGTTNDLRVIEQAIEKLQPTVPLPPSAPERDRPGRSGPASTNAVPRSALPTPIYKTNNAAPFPTHSSKAAQRINAKLDEIILPEIHFDNVSLTAVVTWLDGNVKKSDPEKQGVDFLINNVVSDYIVAVSPNQSTKAGAPVLDPKGNPIASAAKAPKPDLDTALVKVTWPIKALTLRQALDAICKTAVVKLPDGRTAGLKYSIEEYAIVFSPKGPEQAAQFSRMFKVAPETFIEGLKSVVDERELRPGTRAALDQALREKAWTNAPAGTSNRVTVAGVRGSAPSVGVVNTNGTDELNYLVRRYFTAAGVSNLGVTNGPDATQVFFNDRNGLLLVRASLQDLDIIQMAVELLNEKLPEVLVETRTGGVNQNDNKALGYDWLVGTSVTKSESKPATNWVVVIDREGNYRLDGQARSLDQVVAALKQEFAANRNLTVHVRTPKDARLDAAMVLLERCSRLGITNVSFATEANAGVERVPTRPPDEKP